MHLEVLTSKAKELWPKLKYFQNFVLVGGTALALQIGHRISEDFDFFSQKRISHLLFSQVENVFKNTIIKVLVKTGEQLTVIIHGVTLTFRTYPFPAICPVLKFQDIYLLSIDEIAATKAFVLGRRATFKDYVDLYYILFEKHCSLSEIISLSEKKYSEQFETRLFLEQLVYLKDVLPVKIQFLKAAVTKEYIETYLQNEIKKLKLI